jgi:hypothetical protein
LRIVREAVLQRELRESEEACLWEVLG